MSLRPVYKAEREMFDRRTCQPGCQWPLSVMLRHFEEYPHLNPEEFFLQRSMKLAALHWTKTFRFPQFTWKMLQIEDPRTPPEVKEQIRYEYMHEDDCEVDPDLIAPFRKCHLPDDVAGRM